MKKEITIKKLSIIIIVIIVSIVLSIRIGIKIYKLYSLQKFVAQMQTIQENVNKIRDEYKVWENYNPNETGNFYEYIQLLGFTNANSTSNPYLKNFENIINNLNSKEIQNWDKNIDSIITNYYYCSSEDIEKNFNIKNSNLYVIINFTTGNIISKDGIEDINKNEIIYRQYDSSIGNKLEINTIYMSDITPELEVVKNNGLNMQIKISLENADSDISEIYYYMNKDETKKRCSNLKDYEYIKEEKTAYFTIDVSGNYYFIVEDITGVQYPLVEKNFKFCNPPVLAEGMEGIYWIGDEERSISQINDPNWYDYTEDEFRFANAKTEDGNYWVWIPRFYYRANLDNIDIEYIYESSSTSTSNIALNGYKLCEAFSENGEKTGFWISKFQSNDDNTLVITPGETLAITNKNKAQNICNNYLETETVYSSLTNDKQLNSIFLLAFSNNINITNDMSNYSGGFADEFGFIDNIQYSSTDNLYGVYDLYSSENEITKNSNSNEYGRFRAVLNIK